MSRFAILFAVSEIAPWVKTGGLGDVAAALPAALKHRRQDVRVLVPAYPALRRAFPEAQEVASLPSLTPALPPCRLLAANADGLPLLLLDCPELFDRPGNPYLDAAGSDYSDNVLRFGLLSRVAARLGQPDSPLAWQPDIVHLHDWQTALAAAFLHYEGGAASVLTIHNIAFPGNFAPSDLAALALPPQSWSFDGVEYFGHFSFLKAGLQFATRLNTVSPTYAREILDEALGYGFAPLLRYRAQALYGLLNGIDTDAWNPAKDAHLAVPYSAGRLTGKRANKTALQARLGLEQRDDLPLFGVVSRLTEQKGLDLLLTLGSGLAEHLPGQLALLGSGDPALEAGFRALSERYPGRIASVIGFDEALAHQIEAGADIFLMPSRFEPCGLNQMYSLRYGTPPIVRQTGGLADSVVDCNEASLADGTATGFVFQDATAHALWQTLERATAVWKQPRLWRQLQQQGMRLDLSWKRAADAYLALYDDTLAAHRSTLPAPPPKGKARPAKRAAPAAAKTKSPTKTASGGSGRRGPLE
ncbi:glycogen synthase GlgA [Rhodocyclus gracilis]|uniref:Glycogen synthase n=1 Tax=Rhodocyclus tenuis TaxID=1066 RepID=A0A6L5JVG7_RHOTE|nr:glycogen synthase GlgA [Rhodocyclus gracilis]MQY50550.1 glycogen synthase GlgA [Rhodocyclus gracilis]